MHYRIFKNLKFLVMETEKERKGCLYFALIAFALASIKPLLALIFGASSEDLESMQSYDPRTDTVSSDLGYLRITFFLLVLAIIIYLYHKIKSK